MTFGQKKEVNALQLSVPLSKELHRNYYRILFSIAFFIPGMNKSVMFACILQGRGGQSCGVARLLVGKERVYPHRGSRLVKEGGSLT